MCRLEWSGSTLNFERQGVTLINCHCEERRAEFMTQLGSKSPGEQNDQ